MSWRPHSHARVNPRAPEAFGKCDRCGSVFNLVDLAYQFEWVGPKAINKRLKVCSGCKDTLQPQLRTVRLRPDPVPVRDPRPLNNAAVMGGYAVMQRFARVVSTTPGALLVPGTEQVLVNGYLSDAGADASADAAGQPVSVYLDSRNTPGDAGLDAGPDSRSGGPLYYTGAPLGGDAGRDASADAAIVGVPTDNVALALFLNVVPAGIDVVQGYPASPFVDFYADTNQDAGQDAGGNPATAVPISIDPPEG